MQNMSDYIQGNFFMPQSNVRIAVSRVVFKLVEWGFLEYILFLQIQNNSQAINKVLIIR